jgi:hypothetical protein
MNHADGGEQDGPFGDEPGQPIMDEGVLIDDAGSVGFQ